MRGILVKDAEALAAKVTRLRAAGPSSLHLIADFDRTLTHPAGATSWGAVARSPDLSATFKAQTLALYDKYHPHEMDPSLPLADRVRYMEQWWQEAHELLLAQRVTRATFANAVQASDMHFREQTTELVTDCRVTGLSVFFFFPFVAHFSSSRRLGYRFLSSQLVWAI